MSSGSDRNVNHRSPIPKKKYKLWKDESDIPIPIKTLQRWEKNTKQNVQTLDSPCQSTQEDSRFCHDDENIASDSNISNNFSVISSNNDHHTNDMDDSNNACVCDPAISDGNENDSDNSDVEHYSDESDSMNERLDGTVGSITQELLYDNSDITVNKTVVLLMNLYIQHKLTKSALDAILKMLHSILPKPNKLPTSHYRLFQFVENVAPSFQITRHFYCKECLFYRGTEKNIVICESCSKTKDVSHFHELSIEDQIRHLFEHRDLASKLNVAAHEDNLISDITDGSEYIRVNSQSKKNKYDLTLILNTDGISLVKSSKSHCWPLMFMIAELPEHLRESYIVVCGLWYDASQKPLMNTFLQPFCKRLGEYFYDGIDWTDPSTNLVCNTRVVAPLIIADAPARAQIQNIIGFMGKNGCNLCEIETQPSKPIPKKKRVRVYGFKNEGSKLRTNVRMLAQAEKALRNHEPNVKGVKGKSIVSSLPFLDLSTCVLPEYMHSVLLGVGNQFMNLWVTVKEDWSLKKNITEIDNFITNIRPPHFFNRMPRKMSLFMKYKASEFLNFILYYSVPILKNHLPNAYFQHWLLFVISLFNLLQRPIQIHPELLQTEILLKLFTRDVGTLYTDRQYTYNLHQLLHLVECVKRWGPLSKSSAFPFENYNGFIAGCVHGSKHLGQEIVNNIKIVQGIQVLNMQFNAAEFEHTHSSVKKHLLLGKAKEFKDLHNIEIMLLEAEGLNLLNLTFYGRAKINNEIYTSRIYKVIKTNSPTVQVDMAGISVYGTIRFFFKLAENLCFMLQRFDIEDSRTIIHKETQTKLTHILPICEKNEYLLIKLENIDFIGHVIHVGDYICKSPDISIHKRNM